MHVASMVDCGLSEHESDLPLIENIFTRFECVSGALLSRSQKSKVMGLGPWRNKVDWPLPWLRVQDELKVFGFHIKQTFKTTLEKCWNECYAGFHKVLMSWSSRQLVTLVQRVEVIRLFATSKLWYKASALPLPPKFVKKFESAIFKFLWIGKLEKLSLDEIKNPVLSGGLNLPCIGSKADALFLTQTCRLLAFPGNKQYKHIQYWVGLYLKDYFPDMYQGPHAEIVSPYFFHMKALLLGGLILGDVTIASLKRTTAKKLYSGFTSSFPPPKVEYKLDVDWGRVWRRLQSPLLESGAREIMFMLINNIIANRDRLFSKFRMVPSPNCLQCPGVLHDNVHLFCECVLVRESWFWIRQRLLGMLPSLYRMSSNFEFLNLMFESDVLENEVIWIIGVYVQLVWDTVICKKKHLRIEKMKSEISLKYLTHQRSNMPDLGYNVGILN